MSNDVLQIFAMSSDDYTTFLSTLTPAAQDVVRAIFQAGTLDSEDVYYAIVTDDFESWLFADFAEEPGDEIPKNMLAPYGEPVDVMVKSGYIGGDFIRWPD